MVDKVNKIESNDKSTQLSNNLSSDVSLENFASIDYGVVNIATIYSPNRNIRPFIINGREITHINYDDEWESPGIYSGDESETASCYSPFTFFAHP